MGMRMFLLSVMAAFTFNAEAQTYPSRTVRIVVPATPGGAIDLIARTLAEKMTTSLGQAVVVENKPGASNNLGTDFVAKSPPDGYNLVIVASSHATNKWLFKQMPFDPIKDFEPVVYTHVVPLLLAVHPSVGAKTVPELVGWIKANPDKAIYASSVPGSSLHMAAELFMSMTKTKMQHVPYKGSSAAHPDLLAGRTAMIFDTVTAIRGHVKSGAVRGIAVTTAKRSSAMPELPTIAETLPGYDASTWGGILAPAGTPKDAVARLNSSINAALKMEDVRSRLMGAGIEIQGGTPEAFAEVIRVEVDKWGRIVKEAGIQPE
jgi:tripartite-type tricarboxylate transporter receptor subunit TctC